MQGIVVAAVLALMAASTAAQDSYLLCSGAPNNEASCLAKEECTSTAVGECFQAEAGGFTVYNILVKEDGGNTRFQTYFTPGCLSNPIVDLTVPVNSCEVVFALGQNQGYLGVFEEDGDAEPTTATPATTPAPEDLLVCTYGSQPDECQPVGEDCYSVTTGVCVEQLVPALGITTHNLISIVPSGGYKVQAFLAPGCVGAAIVEVDFSATGECDVATAFGSPVGVIGLFDADDFEFELDTTTTVDPGQGGVTDVTVCQYTTQADCTAAAETACFDFTVDECTETIVDGTPTYNIVSEGTTPGTYGLDVYFVPGCQFTPLVVMRPVALDTCGTLETFGQVRGYASISAADDETEVPSTTAAPESTTTTADDVTTTADDVTTTGDDSTTSSGVDSTTPTDQATTTAEGSGVTTTPASEDDVNFDFGECISGLQVRTVVRRCGATGEDATDSTDSSTGDGAAVFEAGATGATQAASSSSSSTTGTIVAATVGSVVGLVAGVALTLFVISHRQRHAPAVSRFDVTVPATTATGTARADQPWSSDI